MARSHVPVALLAFALLVFCSPAEAVGGADARSAAGGDRGTPQPRLAPLRGGSLTVRDPEGGRPWSIRVGKTSRGLVCSRIWQRGRPAPTAVRRSCYVPDARRPAPYVSFANVGDRTIVHGLAGRRVARVEIVGIHAQELRLTRRGRGILGVLAGTLSPAELPVKVTLRDGTVERFDFGAAGRLESLDPVSQQRWELTAYGPRDRGPLAGKTCAYFFPHDGSWSPPLGATHDLVCGDLRAAPFAVRLIDFAGQRSVRGETGITRRTVVVGVAGERVAAVDVLLPDGRRQRLELTTTGRGFLAIYPPDVPAAALRVAFTFVDGTTQTVDRTTTR